MQPHSEVEGNAPLEGDQTSAYEIIERRSTIIRAKRLGDSSWLDRLNEELVSL